MQILNAKNNIFKHILQKEKNPKNVFQILYGTIKYYKKCIYFIKEKFSKSENIY